MTSVIIPQLSRALRFLMRRLLSWRRSVEKAIATDTAKGRPSGMQTIKIATKTSAFSMSAVKDLYPTKGSPLTKFLMTQKIIRQAKMTMAESPATFLISFPNAFNLCWRGVTSSTIKRSYLTSSFSMRVFSPTAQTRARPPPDITIEFYKTTMSGFSKWFSPLSLLHCFTAFL